MKLLKLDPADRKHRQLFLELPFRLYRDCPQWVPPLEGDVAKVFSPRNPFYKNGEAGFFLAVGDRGKPSGRIAVLHNRAYNTFNQDNAAFFYMFEVENDLVAARVLLDAAAGWARERRLSRLIGPKGFTVLDGLGMLVKGFEHRPAFGLPYNPSYYPALVEAAGFTQTNELVSGYLNCQELVMPEKIQRAAELVQKRRGLRVVSFKNRREFIKIIPLFQELYNTALEGTTGNIPLTEEDVKSMADQLIWFADPRLVKIILKEEQPVGFLMAYPDISAAVQRCRGRLFPFGWIDLLLESKRTRWVNINGAAIVERYRGMGGTAILFNEMYKSIRTGKFIHADLVQVGTDNDRMQLELRDLGINFYKVHRLYQKSL